MLNNNLLMKKKKGDVDGWCTATADTRLKNMNKNKPMRTGTVTLWFTISTTRLQVLMIIDSFKSGCWLISFGELSFSWFFISHPLLFCLWLLDFDSELYLTFSWRRPFSYRNQSIDLPCKSMDWFLYDNGLRHEMVN